jgi:uncharacterized delta-60 repeat protein
MRFGAGWFAAAVVLGIAPSASADGEPDESFAGGAGAVAVEVGSASDAGRAMVVQPSGHIVVAGDRADPSAGRDLVVTRLRPGGGLDTAFGGTGTVVTDVGEIAMASGVALDAQGRIVVVGTRTEGDLVEVVVVRYLPDGALDTTFQQTGSLIFNFGGESFGESIAIQLDGKIVIAGSRTKPGEPSRVAVARLNPDGGFDISFDGDGRRVIEFPTDAFGSSVAVQDDGKIVIAGTLVTTSDDNFAVIRLAADGSFDLGFDGNGKADTDFGGDDSGAAVAIHADGHVVVAGTRTSTSGSDFAVGVYREDGSLEATFSGNGKSVADFAANEVGKAVAVQNDGKIVVAGQRTGATGSDFAVARFLPDGSLDPTLDGDGKLRVDLFEGVATDDDAVAVAVAPGGKLVAAGTTEESGEADLAVARFLSTQLIPLGLLEIPGPGSTQSGVGLVSGWLCNGSGFILRIDGVTEVPAYGTPRDDTRGSCGDANNGFGLLFNWGLLGDGIHIVRAVADGKQFSAASFRVTTLGTPFLRGVTAAYDLTGFPAAGDPFSLEWVQSSQSFVITSAGAPAAALPPASSSPEPVEAPAASLGALENPAPGSSQSGIGLVSGWICDASEVRIEIDNLPPVKAAYGTPRGDTASPSICGDTNNGFGMLFNWGLLDDGIPHEIRVRADGMLIGTATFTVTTFGTSFLRDATGHYTLQNFPEPGSSVDVDWVQGQQNFVITAVHD